MTEARAQCGPVDIIDRCNLTVLCEPGQEDTADFLAQHKVRCCLAECDVLDSEVAMRPAAECTGSLYLWGLIPFSHAFCPLVFLKKMEPEEAQLPRQRRLLTASELSVLLPAAAAASGDVQVHVIASLPCYSADNVEKQRGRGVFARSIEVRAGVCA